MMMNRVRIACCTLLVLVLVGGFAAKADAGTPYAGGCGYGFYDYYHYHGLVMNIPHFALHPPVYYSYPVPRTYGYSPFAYPPGTPTPELEFEEAEEVQPTVIRNPYFDGEIKGDVTRAQPRVISNPYVLEDRLASQR